MYLGGLAESLKLLCLQISRQVGNLMDLFPTVLDMADIPPPKDVFLDGHSIKGTLLNKTEQYDRYAKPGFFWKCKYQKCGL